MPKRCGRGSVGLSHDSTHVPHEMAAGTLAELLAPLQDFLVTGYRHLLSSAAMAKTIYRAEYRSLLAILRERRLAACLSQTDVAKALQWSQQKVSGIESGARRLDVLEFIELAGFLGLSPGRAFALATRSMHVPHRSR